MLQFVISFYFSDVLELEVYKKGDYVVREVGSSIIMMISMIAMLTMMLMMRLTEVDDNDEECR